MKKCAKQYGDAFQIKLNYPMVSIGHPKAIEQIFKTKPKQFDSGVGNKLLLPLLGERSLVLLDGTTPTSTSTLALDATFSRGKDASLS